MNTEQKEKAFHEHAPKERGASMRKSSTHDGTKEESEELEQQYQKLRQAAFARRAKGASKRAKNALENTYRFKILVALKQHPAIRGRARRALTEWYREGLKALPPNPDLPWLQEKIWTALSQSVRVATVFALTETDQRPDAVHELYKEIRKLLQPFRGRPTSSDLSKILPEALRLRAQEFSFGEIARRLCPEKHKHNKACTDRIRLALGEYSKTSREK